MKIVQKTTLWYQENQYFGKNMFLVKNQKFLNNHYETLSKWGPYEYLILTKFRNDWIKIVHFLIKFQISSV